MTLRLISEGAESKIYADDSFGVPLIVKARERKGYRIEGLDESIRRGRTRKEAKAMCKARESGANVPGIIAVGRFSIFMERKRGKMLKDVRFGNKEMRAAGAQLAKLHAAGIAHGDFTPANIMLCSNGPCIMDFGLAGIGGGDEEKAIDLLLMKRSVEKPQFSSFIKGYSAYANHKPVLKKLSDIERRSRYKARTLQTV